MRLPLDKVVEKIVALGVPGIVLVVAIHISGLAGGAAIVAALAALGGPLGMPGGLALLAVLLLIARALADYGFEAIMKAALRKMKEQGLTKQAMRDKINGYWFVSQDLRDKLLGHLEEYWPREA